MQTMYNVSLVQIIKGNFPSKCTSLNPMRIKNNHLKFYGMTDFSHCMWFLPYLFETCYRCHQTPVCLLDRRLTLIHWKCFKGIPVRLIFREAVWVHNYRLSSGSRQYLHLNVNIYKWTPVNLLQTCISLLRTRCPSHMMGNPLACPEWLPLPALAPSCSHHSLNLHEMKQDILTHPAKAIIIIFIFYFFKVQWKELWKRGS